MASSSLQQSDMSKVELGKARRVIHIKREVLHHDPVWPNLCRVNFWPPRPTPPDHLSVHEDGYMLATSLLVQVCSYLYCVCVLPSQQQKLGLVSAWTSMNIVGATAVVGIGGIVCLVVTNMFVSSCALLFSCLQCKR